MTTLWVVFCIAISSWNANAIEVSTTLGAIRGVVLRSRLGKDFNAFRGIRYGKSPVGDLRFKNPQPAEAWKPDTFDATEDGPQCPQEPFNSHDNSEDSLRLNVYTKNLSPNILKPVVVYFHPGVHSKSFVSPEFLMDRDIVLVTIGYRLGALGFLATGTPDAPGNAGLKDQVLAMRWVNQHIQNFGGDPNSVTLLGFIAGSVSVGFHMISPMSKGLFHREIAMSASPIPLEKYPENQLDLAKKQAELVNCSTTNFNDMMQYLRKTPAEEFVRTFLDLYNLGYFMLQVIEKDHGQERFLVEDPPEAFQEGRFQRTPLIVGMTNEEFAARSVPVYYYRYSYKGSFSDFLYPEDNTYSYIPPVYKNTAPEDKTVGRLTRIVSQFEFETGNPNNPEDDWKPLDLTKENFLEIGEELVMNEGLFLECLDIWERLYPLRWKGPKYGDQSLDYPTLPYLARPYRRKRGVFRSIMSGSANMALKLVVQVKSAAKAVSKPYIKATPKPKAKPKPANVDDENEMLPEEGQEEGEEKE